MEIPHWVYPIGYNPLTTGYGVIFIGYREMGGGGAGIIKNFKKVLTYGLYFSNIVEKEGVRL